MTSSYRRLILPAEPKRLWRDTFKSQAFWDAFLKAAAITSTIIAVASFVGLFVMLWMETP